MVTSFKRIKNFLKKKENFLLIIFIILATFLRFYRLEDLMVYLGDEGRDMLIVMDMIQGKNFPFIGPPTSVGQLYLGPIYYYMIAPFVLLFNMSPIGPAVFVAILGVLTVPLLFMVGKSYFDTKTGLFAAGLYVASPLVVQYSRSSWNPNPMPFFTLLLLLSFKLWEKSKRPLYFYLGVISFTIMLQLHYMVVLLIPFLLFLIFKLKNNFKQRKTIFISIIILVGLLSPLLLFDLKHDFVNLKGFVDIFKQRSDDGFSIFDLLSRTRDRIRQLFSLFLGYAEREWRTNLIVVTVLIFFIRDWTKINKLSKLIIFGFAIWGFLSIGLYRGSFYPHYLGFLFPIPALLIARSLVNIAGKNKVGLIASLIVFFSLVGFSFKATWQDLSRPPVLNVKLVKKIVILIEKESNGEEFNFALLAKNNYDDSYRYFFRLWEMPAVYQTEVSRQLFVVCEDDDICQPQGNPKWEIALFDAAFNGNIVEAGSWRPDDLIKVYKFIPK